MAPDLANDKFWVNKYIYHDAEKSYYEAMSKRPKSKEKRGHLEKKDGVGMTNVSKDSGVKSSLAGEVAKARQMLKTSMQHVGGISAMAKNEKSSGCNINTDLAPLIATVARLESCLNNFEKRLAALEALNKINQPSGGAAKSAPAKKNVAPAAKAKEGDDDVDLFGSDSDEEDEQAKKIREQRLAEYAAKKSKKPAIVAKSNIVLDIKPWNDETDMKKLEEAVRKIEMDGLVWGASRLMPLVFGIYKLQISCVVEDDKVSVDQLTDTIVEIEDYVQSADIAAFNKV